MSTELEVRSGEAGKQRAFWSVEAIQWEVLKCKVRQRSADPLRIPMVGIKSISLCFLRGMLR